MSVAPRREAIELEEKVFKATKENGNTGRSEDSKEKRGGMICLEPQPTLVDGVEERKT